MNRTRVRPYEAEAARLTLSRLPGDEPAAERYIKVPPPIELAVEDVSFVDDEVEAPTGMARPSNDRKSWTAGTAFALSLTLFAAGFLAYQSVRAVLDALTWWAPSGILLGFLLASVLATGMVAIAGELYRIRRQLKSLGRIDAARREADLLMQSEGHDNGIAFAARLIGIYETRSDLAEPIRDFRLALNSSLRDHEVVARLSSHVLRHLDEQARTAVGRALRDTAVISLASPNGLVDSLITLWRELKMLREIATIYGLSPGLVQQWTLLRRVLSIAATSGLANQAGDMAVQSLGGGLVGRLSANAADAFYTALRTARLGMYTMETCRPVSFLAEERRGMWTFLRKAAVSVLTLFEGRGRETAGKGPVV